MRAEDRRQRILNALSGDEHVWTRLRAERLLTTIERCGQRLAELEGAEDVCARELRVNYAAQIQMAEAALLGLVRDGVDRG